MRVVLYSEDIRDGLAADWPAIPRQGEFCRPRGPGDSQSRKRPLECSEGRHAGRGRVGSHRLITRSENRRTDAVANRVLVWRIAVDHNELLHDDRGLPR